MVFFICRWLQKYAYALEGALMLLVVPIRILGLLWVDG